MPNNPEQLSTIPEQVKSSRRVPISKKQEVPVKSNSFLSGMQKRNEEASNGLLELGGNYDEPNRGKGVVKNSKAAGHANASDYFPLAKNKPLSDPSYNQEFPQYRKEDVERFNDLNEETLKREAASFIKNATKSTKGHIMNTLLAKTKVDRKKSYCSH